MNEARSAVDVERPRSVIRRGDQHLILLDAPPRRPGHQRADQAHLADAGTDIEHPQARLRREQLGGAHRDRHGCPVQEGAPAELLGEYLIELLIGDRDAARERFGNCQGLTGHLRRSYAPMYAAICSASIMDGALVLARMHQGNTDESTTLRPSMPRTRQYSSTTASRLLDGPIAHVDATWWPEAETRRIHRVKAPSSSSSP